MLYGSSQTIVIPGTSAGDFVNFVLDINLDCAGAHSSRLTVQSGSQVTIANGSLPVGIYMVCYAFSTATGDEDYIQLNVLNTFFIPYFRVLASVSIFRSV
jgi:hypothetical protein